jgi:hypothetical protein
MPDQQGCHMRFIVTGIHLLSVLLLMSGCASGSMLVARSKAAIPSGLQSNLTLADQPHPRPEDLHLRALLNAALDERGLAAASPETAAYTLAYWMDESWDEVRVPALQPAPMERVSLYPAQDGMPGRTQTTYTYSQPFPAQDTSRFLSTKGACLALYSRQAPAADRPEAVWEGYIELDRQAAPDRISKALLLLLDYLGTNHVGRVQLPP